MNGGAITADNGIYSLEANGQYTVEITARGTATTGYCILRFGKGEICIEISTQQIAPNTKIVIPIQTEESVSLEIIAQWGTASAAEEKLPYADSKPYVLLGSCCGKSGIRNGMRKPFEGIHPEMKTAPEHWLRGC